MKVLVDTAEEEGNSLRERIRQLEELTKQPAVAPTAASVLISAVFCYLLFLEFFIV